MPKNEFAKDYRHHWIAHFLDGSTLEQFPDDGTQHKFTELWEKRARLDYLEITGLGRPVVINYPPGADPIIYEKCRSDVDGINRIDSRWSYFGYKILVGEKIQKVFLVINQRTGLVSIEFDDSKIRD